jgi:hypothetical protein
MGHACPWLYTPVLYLTIGVNMDVCRGVVGLAINAPLWLMMKFGLALLFCPALKPSCLEILKIMAEKCGEFLAR